MRFKKKFRTIPSVRSIRELANFARSFSDTPHKSLNRHLEEFKIQNIIDVGSNVGQFGLDMRRRGFNGLIVSYEPVEETFRMLAQTIKANRPWKIFQLGLGSIETKVEINISANDGLSSSILKMGTLHLENFPESATVRKEQISISTLDNELERLGLRPEEILLKLDVQGFETEVLKGASNSLAKIPICYIEVSLVPLYEGELSLLPILNQLHEFGHQVIDIFRGVKSKNGQLLQVDILTRNSS